MNIISDDEIRQGRNLKWEHFYGTYDEDESHHFAMLAEDTLESNVLGKVIEIRNHKKINISNLILYQ